MIPRNSRYWLKVLADHYDSLVVSGICHGALKDFEELEQRLAEAKTALLADRNLGEPCRSCTGYIRENNRMRCIYCSGTSNYEAAE